MTDTAEELGLLQINGQLIDENDQLQADLAATRKELERNVWEKNILERRLTDARKELAEVRAREAGLREPLFNCLSLVKLKFGDTDAVVNVAIQQAEAALAGGDNLVGDVLEHPKFVGLWTYRPHGSNRQFCASIMAAGTIQETDMFDTWTDALTAATGLLTRLDGGG